jgi:hypothetical protein
MRCTPQAVDDPQLDAFDRGERGIVECDDVGRVGEPADAQAKGRAETMILRERHNRNALDLERNKRVSKTVDCLVKSAKRTQSRADLIPRRTVRDKSKDNCRGRGQWTGRTAPTRRPDSIHPTSSAAGDVDAPAQAGKSETDFNSLALAGGRRPGLH